MLGRYAALVFSSAAAMLQCCNASRYSSSSSSTHRIYITHYVRIFAICIPRACRVEQCSAFFMAVTAKTPPVSLNSAAGNADCERKGDGKERKERRKEGREAFGWYYCWKYYRRRCCCRRPRR